jgi:hypothetical protein
MTLKLLAAAAVLVLAATNVRADGEQALTLSAPITFQGTMMVPFRGAAHIVVPAGNSGGVAVIEIPAGKRAVIESISILGSMPAATSSAVVGTTSINAFGGLAAFPLPLKQSGTGMQGTLSTKLYADASTQVSFMINQAPSASQQDGNVFVTGYLVEQR